MAWVREPGRYTCLRIKWNTPEKTGDGYGGVAFGGGCDDTYMRPLCEAGQYLPKEIQKSLHTTPPPPPPQPPPPPPPPPSPHPHPSLSPLPRSRASFFPVRGFLRWKQAGFEYDRFPINKDSRDNGGCTFQCGKEGSVGG
ncbi:hypothetical protein HZH68_005749 [Vespula germanica]|uniref:Uncharacterized protein n=1 Tax=Vespula germanica TaxID=30212 RepID=A0A834NDS4_VESGE|nr:hypothetical protein HZH68_005749 [Vespula germanica]